MIEPRSPRLEIHFCTQCRWLLRAAWLAQELLTTFADQLGSGATTPQLGELALIPATGGTFRVLLDGELLFDRAAEGRFPEAKELKQLVRDRIDPKRDLGHSDRSRDRAEPQR